MRNELITNAMNILITLLFGAIAGWLAGFFVIKEKGGLIWNIIIGLLGSFWAQWYGQIVSAVIGAVVLILVWRLIKKLLK